MRNGLFRPLRRIRRPGVGVDARAERAGHFENTTVAVAVAVSPYADTEAVAVLVSDGGVYGGCVMLKHECTVTSLATIRPMNVAALW